MDKLELYAREKEQEKNLLKHQAEIIFSHGKMDEVVLGMIIDKAYHLGHNAGHCRGEMHKDKLKRGAV